MNTPGRDEEWIGRAREAFAPPPMTPGETRSFDARLAERVDGGRSRRRAPWVAGLLAAAASALVWVAWPATGDEAAAPVGEASGELALFEEALERDDDFNEMLPDDLATLAYALEVQGDEEVYDEW